jgi:hypothetical protein
MIYLNSRGISRNILHRVDRNEAAITSGSILTAIPVGRTWRVKAIAQSGEATLLGSFDSRLAALGAGVLLAHRCGGTVLP